MTSLGFQRPTAPLDGGQVASHFQNNCRRNYLSNVACFPSLGVGYRSTRVPAGESRSVSAPVDSRRTVPHSNTHSRLLARLAGSALVFLAASRLTMSIAAGEGSLEGKRFSVEARMEYSQGGAVEAKLVPGEFKIPDGYQAGRITYRFYDPKTGRELTQLGPQTIYSVTEKRYVYTERMEDLTLKAGEYRLAIGGRPGAVGILTYILERADPPLDEKLAAQADRIIEVVSWRSDLPELKIPARYYISGRKAIGKITHVLEASSPIPGFSIEPQPIKGEFVGQNEGNVITGQWKIQTGPFRNKMTDSVKGRVGYRTDTCHETLQARLTLRPDGTISESVSGQVETISEYDAVGMEIWGVKEAKQVHQSSIAPEGVKIEIEGVWKELPRPKKPKYEHF